MNKYFIFKYYDIMYLGYNDFDSVLCVCIYIYIYIYIYTHTHTLHHINKNYELNSSNV